MKKIISMLLSCMLVFGGVAAVYAATPADGTYSVSVSMSGGTGRASVASPTTITVSGGSITATVVWSSPNYTTMTVNGTQYSNQNNGGNSTFSIPVSALDTPISVSAVTTAMSTAHEIDYTLTFSSSGVTMNDGSSSGSSGGSAASGSNSGNSSGGSSASDSKSESADETKTDGNESTAIVQDEKGLTISNTHSKSTSVNAEALAALKGKTLTLSTSKGEIILDKDAVAGLIETAKGGITLTMDDVSKDKEYKASDYGMVVKVSITDDEGNELYTKDTEGKATVTVNYENKVENEKNIKVYDLGNGDKEVKATYDSKAKTVTFDASALSTFALTEASGNTIIIVAAIVILVAAAGVIALLLIKKRKKNNV